VPCGQAKTAFSIAIPQVFATIDAVGRAGLVNAPVPNDPRKQRSSRESNLMSKLLGCAIVALAWAVSAAADSDKIRVIIIDGQNNHDWRSTTPWMKKVLDDSGRFSVAVSSNLKPGDKPGKIADTVPFPPDLSKYDVVLSNYNGADWPKDFQAALEDWLQSGRGEPRHCPCRQQRLHRLEGVQPDDRPRLARQQLRRTPDPRRFGPGTARREGQGARRRPRGQARLRGYRP